MRKERNFVYCNSILPLSIQLLILKNGIPIRAFAQTIHFKFKELQLHFLKLLILLNFFAVSLRWNKKCDVLSPLVRPHFIQIKSISFDHKKSICIVNSKGCRFLVKHTIDKSRQLFSSIQFHAGVNLSISLNCAKCRFWKA